MKLTMNKEFWQNKDKVISFAEEMGRGHTVFKHPDRNNYNICHTENEYRLDLSTVFIIHRT